MQTDARIAYLFQCANEDLFAVTPDKAGANIPRSSCTQGWLFRQELQLHTQFAVVTPIGFDPIIRSINDKGYYIWRDPSWMKRATNWLATPIRFSANEAQEQPTATQLGSLV